MKVLDLRCSNGHLFEGWFASEDDFMNQNGGGLVECPLCADKVVGRLLLDGRLPATDLGLYVSGRAGFEIVQKAWAAGFSAVVAVSAPSALAVEAAQQAGMTLVGFVRGDPPIGNLYSPPTAR